MISCIYTITSPSGRQYVGSAMNRKRRWNAHRYQLRSDTHKNCNLRRAAKKYGIENLIFATLLICRPEDLLFYEQRAFDVLKPEYNIDRIAGSSRGLKRSEEFCKKISKALHGRPVSLETRVKMSAAQKGKKCPIERIQKMRLGLARKQASGEIRTNTEILLQYRSLGFTPEGRAKRSAAMIGHKVSAETRAKIAKSLMGRRHSPERIAAIMAGKKLRPST